MDYIDNKRILTIDLARCIALIMMIQGHTLFELSSAETWNSSSYLWQVWNFFRGITAPAFLIISGVALSYANKRTENGRLLPGIIPKRIQFSLLIISIGYLMHFPTGIFKGELIITAEEAQAFKSIDILQLIGATQLLSLLYFIIFRPKSWLWPISLITGFVLIVLTPFAGRLFGAGETFVSYYLSPDSGSRFTIFPYAAYLFFGISLGTFLQWRKINAENFFRRYGLLTATILLALGLIFIELINSISPFYLGRLNPAYVFSRAGFVMAGITIISYISKALSSYSKYIIGFGRHSLLIYVMHMIILYGAVFFSGLAGRFQNALSPGYAFLIALIVIAVSFGWGYVYDIGFRRRK